MSDYYDEPQTVDNDSDDDTIDDDSGNGDDSDNDDDLDDHVDDRMEITPENLAYYRAYDIKKIKKILLEQNKYIGDVSTKACSVCLEDLSDVQTEIIQTECNHFFCVDCIVAVLKDENLTPNTCPNCRKKAFECLDIRADPKLLSFVESSLPQWIDRIDDGTECPCCRKSLNSFLAVVETVCKHTFCVGCITKHLIETRNTCPVVGCETKHPFEFTRRIPKNRDEVNFLRTLNQRP
jgi:hypothetical protein